jgi:adenylate kinase
VTIRIWSQNAYANTVLGLFKPSQDLLVLDGLPRNVKQAKLLYKYIDVLQVISLVCKDKEALFERMKKRAMKQNRPDDAQEDVIRRRFEVYENETRPVLEFYDDANVAKIDALQSPAAVLGAILDAIVPMQNTHFNNPLAGA